MYGLGLNNKAWTILTSNEFCQTPKLLLVVTTGTWILLPGTTCWLKISLHDGRKVLHVVVKSNFWGAHSNHQLLFMHS